MTSLTIAYEAKIAKLSVGRSGKFSSDHKANRMLERLVINVMYGGIHILWGGNYFGVVLIHNNHPVVVCNVFHVL